MSKGRARLAILALSAPLLVALSLVTACGAGEERPRPTPEAGEEPVSYKLREQNWEYWEGIEALLQRTLKGVSETRELSPPEETQLRVVTANWATENWGHNYVKENSRKIEIDEWIWKALFILPDDVMLADLYAQWPGSYLLAVWEDKVYFVQDHFGKLGGGDRLSVKAVVVFRFHFSLYCTTVHDLIYPLTRDAKWFTYFTVWPVWMCLAAFADNYIAFFCNHLYPLYGRGGRIRTDDHLNPIEVRWSKKEQKIAAPDYQSGAVPWFYPEKLAL